MTLLALLRDHGHEASVVISDIVMRVPNGWDIVRQLRKRTGPTRPLLIAISGRYTKNSNRIFAQMLGFDFFLPKPCEPQVLMALIEKARAE